MAPTPAPPKMNQKDHYATLEINRDATAKGIKDAYRKLALKCHPDHGGSNAAMQNVTAAYEELSNPNKRRMYDRKRFGGRTRRETSFASKKKKTSSVPKEDTEEGGDHVDTDNGEEAFVDRDDSSDRDYVPGEDFESKEEDVIAVDSEDPGASYKVETEDSREVSLEEHELICGCELEGKKCTARIDMR